MIAILALPFLLFFLSLNIEMKFSCLELIYFLTQSKSNITHQELYVNHFISRPQSLPIADYCADQLRGLLERIMGEVGIARRCLHALVAKQAADDRQRQPSADSEARKAVPQIVDAHVIKPSQSADTSPGFLQVDQMLARHLADDDIGIALLAGKTGKEIDGGRVERDNLGAMLVGLVVLKD